MSTFEPDASGPPPLERWQQQRLLEAMYAWVGRIRDPDEPLIGYQGLGFASPRDLVRAVAIEVEGGESELGQRYLHSVSLALAEIPFEAFVASIERSGSPRSVLLRRLLEAFALVSFELRRLLKRRQVIAKSRIPS